MSKIADVYYSTNPWSVIEEGFNPSYSLVSESIFSLGNEYMGVRGYFDEGYSGKRLIGSYFNGIYETQKIEASAYKGMIDKIEFIVNAVDWLYLRIEIDGEVVDLNRSGFKDFRRELNLRTGILTRSYTWILEDKREVKLEFERFLSMEDAHFGGQRLRMTALNFSGNVLVTAGLDFSNNHQMVGKNLWNCREKNIDDKWCSILADTINTKQSIYSCCYFEGNIKNERDIIEEKRVLKQFTFTLQHQKPEVLTRVVKNITKKGTLSEDDLFVSQCRNREELSEKTGYDFLKAESAKWWEKMWEDSDIVIDGDELNQQGIRFCIFQMHQTYHGADKGTIIGAKGLTGEAYSGNTFWDTETYCLPFYIFNNADAAKNLLNFRSLTLPQAKERAKALDCEGAFYPVATISGRECCSLWQHASLQLQASTAVAYGIRHYENITKDEEFVLDTGLPILIEISRMLASRGDWNADRTKYGFYGVMGPDEFQMMVNNNCYTNFMGKFTYDYTLDTLERYKKKDRRAYDTFLNEKGLTKKELDSWSDFAKHMYIPYEEDTMLFEQNDGYFDLPHMDIARISTKDFPLYHHWSYDRIYRNDMIKQPDVLMMMLLFNGKFTKEQLLKNYEYYEPRCIHESSLSPSVHSILAVQLQKHEEAYKFFGFATRMDLDNYNRNTSEGLHTTSIAAAWMNIVYGFGGMRSDGDVLSFSPSIPKAWKGYSFRIHYQEDVIEIEIKKDKAYFHTVKGSEINVMIYEQPVILRGERTMITIPNEWRG
ncbi:MAG: family 65 glycosyl hydrolase [Anaerolineaceae bacterium]|nr:MAG: family 65 glycosyl hydrolase [Anaerolineaceae bacterium]